MEVLLCAIRWMNLQNSSPKWRKPEEKKHITYDSVYMKFPEQEKLIYGEENKLED